MNGTRFFLIILFLSGTENVESIDQATSVTDFSWFWPVIIIASSVLISVPCVAMTIIFYCQHHQKYYDDSNESIYSSSSASSSLTSSTPIQERSIFYHIRPHRSNNGHRHYDLPPPYTTSDAAEGSSIQASLPPPYTSYSTINDPIRSLTPPHARTNTNIQLDNVDVHSTYDDQAESILDISNSTNKSIQTI